MADRAALPTLPQCIRACFAFPAIKFVKHVWRRRESTSGRGPHPPASSPFPPRPGLIACVKFFQGPNLNPQFFWRVDARFAVSEIACVISIGLSRCLALGRCAARVVSPLQGLQKVSFVNVLSLREI